MKTGTLKVPVLFLIDFDKAQAEPINGIGASPPPVHDGLSEGDTVKG